MSSTAATSPTPPTAPESPDAPGQPAPASRPSPLNLSRTTATAARALRQLRHDPRTIALMILVPCVMLVLLRYVFDGSPQTFDSIGASLLGIFPLITMFLVTSIATLRERTSGTLERLLAMPLGKGDLIAGYALAFGAIAIVQSALATGLAVWLLGLDVTGSPWLLLLVALLDALLGTALGLFVSAFAASEFQAVQFMPAGDLPAAPPLRPVHPALEHAPRPGGHLRRPPHVVRGRRHERGPQAHGHDRDLRTRRADRRRDRAAGAGPRSGDPATQDAVGRRTNPRPYEPRPDGRPVGRTARVRPPARAVRPPDIPPAPMTPVGG